MIGGYLVAVPRTSVQPIGTSGEGAPRFILTAGITRTHNGNPAEKSKAKQQERSV